MTEDTSSLSDIAKSALAAYHNMSDSKHGYFSYLQMIEQKYQHGGKATPAEEDELGELLLAHDKRVTEFNQAMEKVTDDQDRVELIKHMGG